MSNSRILFGTALVVSTTLASAKVVATEAVEQLANLYQVPESHVLQCLDTAMVTTRDKYNTSLRQCLKGYIAEEDVEYIEVYGRYIGLEVPEISGRFSLDKTFIDAMPKGTGDINDLILMLPGVQGSESALNASNAGEISAKLLSISGGQPWQTGFFLDGLNFNSRQDPGTSEEGIASVNDVYGAPQTFTVNSDIVDSVDVYNNNIPARFGYFSGGVVDVEGLNAFNPLTPTFAASYRKTQSSWGDFHLINGFDSQSDSDEEIDTSVPLEDQVPVYNITSQSLLLSHKFNAHHGLLISANYLNSEISDISLQELVETSRENINVLVKYSLRDSWIDKLDWSMMYAPYQNKNLLTNVKDSWFTIDGGGLGSVLRLQQALPLGTWHTELSVNYSDNSRKAPSHYYIWQQAKGVEWGQNDPNNASVDVSYSKSGGFGDLDKRQLSSGLSSYFNFDTVEHLGLLHHWELGVSWLRDDLRRRRKQDSYYYNSSIVYSSSDINNPLNCSGYTNDCIGISYAVPLDEFADELGGSIDFSDPLVVQAYADNVLTTPQYFQARTVYGAEDIKVHINQYSAYAEDSFDWGLASFRLGLRYDYDDFFKRHNIAPRLTTGIDVFDSGNSLLVLGLNRYYDAGLLTYKVKELQRPYYVQYRPIQNGYLQGWTLSSDDSDYRYKYEDVTTPYNDEAMFGWKQDTEHFGTFSLNYVYRWQRDQLARSGESVVAADGYRYAYQDNSGEGTSKRVSLAWSAKFGRHSLWANVSHTQNESNNNDYDSAIDDVPLDELVWYEGEVITKDQLTRINTNFSRPVVANWGWTIHWQQLFMATLSASYSGGYTSAVTDGGSYSTDVIERLCSECAAYNLVIPYYKKVEFKARTLVNLALKYTVVTSNYGNMQFSLDVSNLFNRRTYTVTPGNSGIETGRLAWLGVKYFYD
jgi:hypothetical protein